MWGETANALRRLFEAVPDAGNVHLGDRDIVREEALVRLFRWGAGLLGQRPPLRGVRIIRESVSESWWSNIRTKATERWVIRILQGRADRSDSEAGFQSWLDRIWLPLRDDVIDAVKDAAGSGVEVISVDPQRTPGVNETTYCGRVCHYAEIALDAVELVDIVVGTAPAHVSSQAVTREGYVDVAEQLALLIETLPVGQRGPVHLERPWVLTTTERIEKNTVESETESAYRRRPRCWHVYRERDEERRGLGNVVDGSATWKLTGHWGLYEKGATYDGHQRHADEVRAKVRGVGNLGNLDNPTLVLSSPLMLKFEHVTWCGILSHLIDGEIVVKENVHAAHVA